LFLAFRVAAKWRHIFTATAFPRLIRQTNSPQKDV